MDEDDPMLILQVIREIRKDLAALEAELLIIRMQIAARKEPSAKSSSP